MSGISQNSFNGVRSRFQRLADSRFFVGWVLTFYSNLIVVRGMTDAILTPGEEYYFEIHGVNAMATFTARLKKFDELDVLKNANFHFVHGADTQVISVGELDIEFEITSQVRYSRAVEQYRLLVNKMTAEFECKGKVHEMTVADISPGGMGLIGETSFSMGDKGVVRVFSEFGVIHCDVDVRYSIRDPRSRVAFRTGAKIANMSRVDEAKWTSLLSSRLM